MDVLSHYAEKATRRVVGLSASATGIDAVLLDIAGSGAATRISLRCFRRSGYPAQTRDALLRAASPECPGIEICRLNFAMGHLLADAAKQVVRSKGCSLDEIDLIGCGGLPLYHLMPQGSAGDSADHASILQLGELAVVAEQTGVTTVGDFGASDIAAGGCGAPLMPFVDFVLFHHASRTRAVQTIDRMASVTLVPAGDDPEALVAFDTGPGHLVVDTITSVVSEGKLLCDHDGRLASLGQVNPELLEHMMAHPFIRRSPPKSSSGAEFGSDFIGSVLDVAEHCDITVEDLLATATAFTAESIAVSYREFLASEPKIDEIILGGDGSYNAALRRMLKSRLPGVPFYLHEDFGIYGKAKSSVGCAILANETMLGRASNIRRATGAAPPRALGKIIPGANRA